MRYTTIIDITELREVYRSTSAKLLYLHMVLKAGYHDYDRDFCRLSIRSLAMETRLSVSSVRCALKKLESLHLIRKTAGGYLVTKFIMEQPITKRARTKRQQQDQERGVEREQAQQRLELEHQENAKLVEDARAKNKTPFMVWYEDMQRKADAGDIEAAESVRRNRAVYEAHAAQFEKGGENG